MTIRGTRPPAVTAELAPWYVNGSPITFAGHFYYPAGPRVHFLPFEMVRSGDFLGIPLYSRTTIEPYSVIFIPVGGGMMQPFERRREGELAGTEGSSAPSFPVALDSDSALDNVSYGPAAAAPPVCGACQRRTTVGHLTARRYRRVPHRVGQHERQSR